VKDKKLPDPKTMWQWTRTRLADEISATCDRVGVAHGNIAIYAHNESERDRNIAQLYVEARRALAIARECLNRLSEKKATQKYIAESLALETAREAHARAIEAARTAESYLE
jgi:hypothetical protein